MLMKTPNQSLTEQLVQRMAEQIESRLLAPGARLPSVRQGAAEQGVSAATVVAAYDRLLAQGLIEARPKRGFFVRERSSLRGQGVGGAGHRAQEPAAQSAAAPMKATALIRGMFHEPSPKPQPGMGVLPPHWMETQFLPTALRRVVRAPTINEVSLRYGEPQGDVGLREALSLRLRQHQIEVPARQIVTTLGATHALDVVSRTLLRAGDPVMVEEPGWAVEFARLAAMGMRILPVPRRADGPDLDVMRRYCETHQPKLYVSVSVLHNPTGHCLAPATAQRVVELAHAHGFHIVEDDTYSHLAPDHSTRLSALDGLRRTIYVGGFAKILAPNWRVGFLAAPPDLVEALLDAKLLGTLTTPALLEKAMAIVIEQGQLRRHAERVRTRLDAARQRTVRLALQAGCRFAAEPAGLFGWVDTGVDTEVLARRMHDDGYLLAPGALFHATRQPSTLMRINFASAQDATFWRAYERRRSSM